MTESEQAQGGIWTRLRYRKLVSLVFGLPHLHMPVELAAEE